MSLQGILFTPAVGLAIVDPLVKLKHCSFIYSRNIAGGLKFFKGSRDPNHATFSGNISPLGLG